MASAASVREADIAQAAWNSLVECAQEWFHDPDLDALSICLSAVAGHYCHDAEPIWLFLIGPSGCGKTTLGIYPQLGLPNTLLMGALTDKTFISGFKGNPGLLHNLGPSGILLFKDFSTILSTRAEAKAEIVGQLREIYDGKFQRFTGTKRIVPPWEGKVTVLAAVTPNIEQHWNLMRELGDRFVAVRWPRGDGMGVAAKARKQRGHERQIRHELQERVSALVDVGHLTEPLILPESYALACDSLAEMVAMLRGIVPRHYNGHSPGEISGSAMVEAPSRLSHVFSHLATSHANLMRRPVNDDDFRLVRRCAFDTLPAARRTLLASIPPGAEIGTGELTSVSGLPPGSISYYVGDLRALGVVETNHNTVEHRHRFTDRFSALLRDAESHNIA